MIDCKSLRLGNWVMDMAEEKHSQVVAILAHQNEIAVSPINEVLPESVFEPIPLTEDILLRCGFEMSREEPCWYINPNNSLQVFYDFEQVSYGSYLLDETSVKYLHQLMNLYYFLTGKELNYSPNNQS